MNPSLTSRVAFGAFLVFAATPLFAHSGAISNHVSNAATLSTSASGQAIAASGEISAAAVKATAGAAAIAFWSGGSAVASAGTVVATVGDSVTKTGTTVTRGAGAVWDFASGDPARRPALNRQRSVPPLKQAVKRDPSPAEMLRSVKR